MIDYELVEKHFNTAKNAVESEKKQTPEDIEAHLKLFKQIFEMNEETFKEMVDRILAIVPTSLEPAMILSEPSPKWFTETRADRGSKRFDAYEKYLQNVAGYSSNVVTTISNSMDTIMNNIGDPNFQGDFSKKGLVIGDVQSGKTGNFIALMNKAADSGYNMIVITTGTIEKLRRQTQVRIEEGFFGYFTASRKRESKSQTVRDFGNDEQTLALTNADKDFNLKTANPVGFGSAPIVAVIKKNKRSLEDLAEWLENNNQQDIKRFGRIDRSILFIDDEADNATVNTKKEEDPTTINRGIRAILNLFQRSSYVGFTATPFANIMIDHKNKDDLFPSSFIQVLETPTNYMGASTIFPEEDEGGIYHSILISNDDAEDYIPIVIPKKEKATFVVEKLPETMKEAICVFFLQNAIRDLRGDNKKHRSMLINVSHLNMIQEQVNYLVEAYVGDLKRQIKQYISNKDESIHLILKELFQEKFYNISENWEDVYQILYKSTDTIENYVINNANKGFQYEDYPNGARVIAVGGFALSRGLTLEGLSTSYLYRNTLMYDTLMQMGRWFGYRPNYDDIIYLYMPERSVDWYYQILQATNDLKKQIKDMINGRKTPEDFGYYIREAENKDEATILITARNKMRNAKNNEVTIRISGDYKETTKLSLNVVKKNRKFVESWIDENNSLFDDELFIKDASKEIVEKLLSKYDYGFYNKLNNSVVEEAMNNFEKFDIKIGAKSGANIAISSIREKSRTRAFRYVKEFELIAFGNSRIGSVLDGKYGLTEPQEEKAKFFKSEKEYFSEFHANERNPLIILFPIILPEPKKTDKVSYEFWENHQHETFWALSLGVPNSDLAPISYRTKMNTVLQQQLLTQRELEEDDEYEEDIE
ncbi:Z1 domain-containing protein [Carnobacterium divergens]|uniref:Z1 domain-containing protein n=1 Tax=Carnobacterium divergens TaxID=2748 RepID=A0AAW8RBB1_CARDV|nr:Z1 domain-containing protein [Carnobacterium divergens]MDT1958789.1 Z1 domain-containing protein [Carnobacterium divergens]MDT1974757.1 Z1 domain-containing protein [Carnobacterium divergens]